MTEPYRQNHHEKADDALRELRSAPSTPRPLPFWGGFMSQWHLSLFILDDLIYNTAEHFMMAEKARLFNDATILRLILATPSPKEAKAFGRQIAEYDEDAWAAIRYDVVIKGNLAKFSADEVLREMLINTDDSILVEASPYDRVWGVGLGLPDRRVYNPKEWQGSNYLGFALMEVRETLRQCPPA